MIEFLWAISFILILIEIDERRSLKHYREWMRKQEPMRLDWSFWSERLIKDTNEKTINSFYSFP